MRTLIINSMFANALYRRCADELGALPGVELTMMTVDEWRMNGRVMPFDEVQPGSPYGVVVGKAGWKGFENRGFYRSGLRRAFQVSRPDVLFLMEEPFSVFALEVLAARALFAPKTPVVFFTWNNLSLEIFDYRPSVFYRNVARRTLPRMDYALTANSDGIDVLRSAGFQKPAKVVGYGVDTQAYSEPRPERARELRKQLRIPDDRQVIGYVGRLLTMKGLDLLLEAFRRISEARSDVTLLLLGGGEEEARFLSMVKSLGLEERVRHVQVVPQRDVPDYMHTLDILVLPSRRVRMWAEQFGRVLVEAMAAGKTVIGSTSGAIPEVIGDAGLVFQENDVDDLSVKLAQAVSMSPSERQALSDRAKRRASEDYSWRRFAENAYEAFDYVHRRPGGAKR